MKKKNHTFLVASYTALMLAASLTVKASDSQFSVGGVQLCGNLADAVEMLKRKGFFNGYPPGRLDQLIRPGVGVSTKKSQNDNMDNIRYSLQHQDGKVVRIQYEVKDDASATTEAAQANELAAKITGVSSRCKSSNGMELCQYRKGTTQITIRSYQSPARLNVSASSQCK